MGGLEPRLSSSRLSTQRTVTIDSRFKCPLHPNDFVIVVVVDISLSRVKVDLSCGRLGFSRSGKACLVVVLCF